MKDIKPIKKDGNWIDVLSGEELVSIKNTKRHPTYGVKLYKEGITLGFKKEPESFEDFLDHEKKRIVILEMLQRKKSVKEIILQLEKKKVHFDTDKIQREIKDIKETLL